VALAGLVRTGSMFHRSGGDRVDVPLTRYWCRHCGQLWVADVVGVADGADAAPGRAAGAAPEGAGDVHSEQR
jgi:hypothetical protein